MKRRYSTLFAADRQHARQPALPRPLRCGSIKSDANFAHGANGHVGYQQRHRFTLEFQAEYARIPSPVEGDGHPVVLTINGKAELVVQDTASYQKLIELAERPSVWMP